MQKNGQLVETICTLSKLMKEQMSYSTDLTTLTLAQLQTLIFLKNHRSVSMRDIANHFSIELPSATSLLNKLHSVELVERQQDEKDRRIVRIALTAKGESLLKEAMEQRTKKISHMLSSLSQKDQDDLLRILQILVAKLKQNNET